MDMIKIKPALTGAFVALCLLGSPAMTDSNGGDYHEIEEAEDYETGAPAVASEAWTLGAGGRIYDNWWNALGRDEPTTTNPAYPASAQKDGPATWRCKECHGWDYLGATGVYSNGSHFTGIKGIDGAIGQPIESLMTLLRDQNHPYTTTMINDVELARVALFVSKGQMDVAAYIDLDTRTMKAGDPNKGRGTYQTICAACHGFDGRFIDWGDGDTHNYVGTEAANLADEVLHKVRSAHPGVAMANLRAFPDEMVIDLMAYIATLPTE